MTRIAGLIAPDAARAFADVEHDLAVGRVAERRTFRTVEPAAGAVFGALGDGGRTTLAETSDFVIAVDGDVFVEPHLLAGGDPAIAQLITRFGVPAALERLRGEFALAVYDRRSRELWIARDRFGVKPLYYTTREDLFAFASRPRPLLRFTGVGARPNRRWTAVFAASHYRYIDNRPEESPYERISQLPAAHWLRFASGSTTVGRYWSLGEAPEWTDRDEQLAERYRDLLLDAVSIRQRAAAAPAFTLSGGMDSSTILGCAAIHGGPQTAFSSVYSDRTYDESAEIRSMLGHAVSRWHPVTVDRPDVFGLVREMVAANDEPVATATWLSHYELCQAAAAAGFGSLFGGLGGDELNAGEYEYFFFHFADLAAGGSGLLDHEIDQWAAHHDHPIFRKNRSVAIQTMNVSTDPSVPGRCLPNLARMRRYYPALRREFFEIDSFAPIMEAPFRSYLKNRTFQDLTRETAPCCLRAEDRHTEAFGLSNYVPFFDHRLVEFMFRVPGRLKIRDGVTKVLLRSATAGIVADETRARIKKTGWNAPAHLWFAGRGRERLLDMVHSQRFRERGIYDVDEVARLAAEHETIVAAGELRENHMMFFWQLVNLETWLEALDG
jgi:asparagine synthase (glutamine-hydrolysing)